MRELLSERRRCLTHTFRVVDKCGSRTTVHFGVGFYTDGRVGELFIDMHKFGAALRDWAHVAAMSFSCMLQFGAPLVEVCELYRGLDADPHGTVEGLACVNRCTSIIDAIAQELSCVYADAAVNLTTLAGYVSAATTNTTDHASGASGPLQSLTG